MHPYLRQPVKHFLLFLNPGRTMLRRKTGYGQEVRERQVRGDRSEVRGQAEISYEL
jgi:hypothetical protein